jgi:hypothetical protein
MMHIVSRKVWLKVAILLYFCKFKAGRVVVIVVDGLYVDAGEIGGQGKQTWRGFEKCMCTNGIYGGWNTRIGIVDRSILKGK